MILSLLSRFIICPFKAYIPIAARQSTGWMRGICSRSNDIYTLRRREAAWLPRSAEAIIIHIVILPFCMPGLKIKGSPIDEVSIVNTNSIEMNEIRLSRLNVPQRFIFTAVAIPVMIFTAAWIIKPVIYLHETICSLVHGRVRLYCSQ